MSVLKFLVDYVTVFHMAAEVLDCITLQTFLFAETYAF
jgi:hypothetical protein